MRERVRINGIPLSREQFCTFFWDVYDDLCKNPWVWREGHGLKSQPVIAYRLPPCSPSDDFAQFPAYFRATMLLALKAFEFHDVDVAIWEVGMGGLYDATNVVDEPVVCAITHLGELQGKSASADVECFFHLFCCSPRARQCSRP